VAWYTLRRADISAPIGIYPHLSAPPAGGSLSVCPAARVPCCPGR